MAYEFYVTANASKQGKLKGESTRQRNEDKQVGLAFHYSVGSPRDAATGRTSGRRTHQPVSFVKKWGASSPQFFTALTTNESFKFVLFEFVSTNESGEEHVFHTIKLLNALVTEIEQYVEPGDTGPLEKISFTFQQIELENIDGKTTATDEQRQK
jgi:type VI secretion system secreted protein Hcp